MYFEIWFIVYVLTQPASRSHQYFFGAQAKRTDRAAKLPGEVISAGKIGDETQTTVRNSQREPPEGSGAEQHGAKREAANCSSNLGRNRTELRH
jgi:hypothetical protein